MINTHYQTFKPYRKVEENKGKTVRWLLDGRQRKNALAMMYDDPENIYNWAKRFIGFKNSDQPTEIEEKFITKINEYIEADLDEEFEMVSAENTEDDSEAKEDNAEESIDAGSYGLDLLLDIIKVIHNKQKKNTGFTKPFDFTRPQYRPRRGAQARYSRGGRCPARADKRQASMQPSPCFPPHK